MNDAIKTALQQDARRAPNCFNINMAGGLEDGFYLDLSRERPGGGNFPPQLRVGERFVLQNQHGLEACLYQPCRNGGLVRRAALQQITPEGKKPFLVLSKPKDSCGAILLHVDSGLCTTGTNTVENSVLGLRLRSGISGSAEIRMQNSSESLVEFTKNGQDLFVRYPTGLVHHVIRQGGRLVQQPLAPAAMTEVWLDLAQQALTGADRGDPDRLKRHQDGVMFGVVKLLTLTRSELAVRELILDFIRHRPGLTSGTMRDQIRSTLQGFGDRTELEFAVDSRVDTKIGEKRSGPHGKQIQRKQARAARDRAEREERKGGTAGKKSKAA